jgi:hypothetical protein
MGALKAAVSSLRSVGDDFATGASNTISTGVKKGTSPLSIAAVGGAGAYSYGQYTDAAKADAQTERYTAYQKRLSEIELMYDQGEITRDEMMAMKEQAEQDFRRSNGDDNPDGLSLAELLAQMGTIQLLASAGVASLAIYFVARPIASRIVNEDSLEALLG